MCEIPWADSAPLPREHEGVLDALLAVAAHAAQCLLLNLEQAEVGRVLGEVGGQQRRNMLAVE